MKVKITLEFSAEDRYALAHFYGQPGKATPADLRAFIVADVDTTFDDLRLQLLEDGAKELEHQRRAEIIARRNR